MDGGSISQLGIAGDALITEQNSGHWRDDFDGSPILLSAEQTSQTPTTEHVSIEFWGREVPEGTMKRYSDEKNPEWGFAGEIKNNTYKGLRAIEDGYTVYYSVHWTGEGEFYDSIVRSSLL